MELTQQHLNSLLTYKDGLLYRKNGKQACPKSKAKGYKILNIGTKTFLEHRIIYVMKHGEAPEIIDHIDGNPLNNRIENLRPATKSQNLQNAKLNKKNTSGVKGVCWSKKNNRWIACLEYATKRYYVGYFKEIIDAEKAIQEKRKELCKEFTRHK
jgi:hypothetical protein